MSNIFQDLKNDQNKNHDKFFRGETLEKEDDKAFERIVLRRRSVRLFTKEKVPKEIIRKCLEMALLAPNSSNLQPWEFYHICDEELKIKLAKACFSQPAATTAQELIVCVARTKLWKKRANQMLTHFQELEREGRQKIPNSAKLYYKKIVPFVYGMIGPCGILGPFKKILLNTLGLFRLVPRGPVSKAELATWAIKTTALACENIMLALTAYGYDSCPMEGFDEKVVKRLLDLTRDAHVVMIIGAGKGDSKGIYGPRVRFDASEFLFEK